MYYQSNKKSAIYNVAKHFFLTNAAPIIFKWLNKTKPEVKSYIKNVVAIRINKISIRIWRRWLQNTCRQIFPIIRDANLYPFFPNLIRNLLDIFVKRTYYLNLRLSTCMRFGNHNNSELKRVRF